MIFWTPGRGFRMLGCGTALLATIVIALLVYALSGGQCTMIVFP